MPVCGSAEALAAHTVIADMLVTIPDRNVYITEVTRVV